MIKLFSSKDEGDDCLVKFINGQAIINKPAQSPVKRSVTSNVLNTESFSLKNI